MPSKNTIKNTADLRNMLIATIEQVRDGTLDPNKARTIATLSTTVLTSAKIDLEYLRFQAKSEIPLNKMSLNLLGASDP